MSGIPEIDYHMDFEAMPIKKLGKLHPRRKGSKLTMEERQRRKDVLARRRAVKEKRRR